jgi:hypothetical protein
VNLLGDTRCSREYFFYDLLIRLRRTTGTRVIG